VSHFFLFFVAIVYCLMYRWYSFLPVIGEIAEFSWIVYRLKQVIDMPNCAHNVVKINRSARICCFDTKPDLLSLARIRMAVAFCYQNDSQ